MYLNKNLRLSCLFFTILYFFTGIVAPVFADASYSYDANGNMTSDGQNCYTYNDANQLSQVKNCATNQVIAQYVYDYQGNRIEKKLYSSGTFQKTVYSPDKTYETVKQATVSGTTGVWTTGSSSTWAAVIASFNPGASTPALVQKNKGSGGGSGSVATSFTSSVTTGNTIILMTITASASNLDTTSVTDNQSNTYTQIGTTQHTPGNAYIRLWYAKNVTGGSVTVTAHQSGSASGCLMEILEYSNLSSSNPADQSTSTTGNSSSPSGGSITPTDTNALVISAFTDDNSDGVSITGTTGYTVEESDTNNSTSDRNGIEDKILTSGAATSSTSYYYVNDDLAAKKNSDGSKNYFLADNLGSTNVQTNQSGTTVENSTYYPYGQIRSGGTQNKYLYTGQENDSETNLDYYNARYYNSSIMHFIQPDTEIPDIYDPQSLNRYSYVEDNPLTYSDPSGHGIFDGLLRLVTEVLSIVKIISTVQNVISKVSTPNAVQQAPKVVQIVNKVQSNPVVQKITNSVSNIVSKVTNSSVAQKTTSTVLRGAQNPNVSARAAYGRYMHSITEYDDGMIKEYDDIPGIRLDAADPETLKFTELKPDSATGISQGTRQISRYEDVLYQQTGQKWVGELRTYQTPTDEELQNFMK